jgi:hypothetical protein
MDRVVRGLPREVVLRGFSHCGRAELNGSTCRVLSQVGQLPFRILLTRGRTDKLAGRGCEECQGRNVISTVDPEFDQPPLISLPG